MRYELRLKNLIALSFLAVLFVISPGRFVKAAEIEDEITEAIEEQGYYETELSEYSVMKERYSSIATASFTRYNPLTTAVEDRDWLSYRTTYVYDQMNASEKLLYNRLEENCIYYAKNSSVDAIELKDSYGNKADYLSPVSYTGLTLKEMTKVVQLFIYNNPQYYFTTTAYAYNTDTKQVYLYCYPEFADGDDRAEVTNDIFDTVDLWLSEIETDNSLAIDIEKAAHDLLCSEVIYENGTFSQSIYSVLATGKSVCAGYSLTFELLMNAAGIPTVATFSDVHAWNKIKLDDNWYAIDVTWDDGGNVSQIHYTYYNMSDVNIKKYDTGSAAYAHDEKMPSYYPKASSDYVGGQSGDEDEVIIGGQQDEQPGEVTVELSDNQEAEQIEDASQDEVLDEQTKEGVVPASQETTPVIDTVTETSETDDVEDEEEEEFDDEEDIELEPSSIKKLKAGKKKCKVTWKKIKDIDGYELCISTSKKFNKSVKYVKASNKETSLTLKKLKKGKTYYIRIRTYKKIDGYKCVSDWSGVKKVSLK